MLYSVAGFATEYHVNDYIKGDVRGFIGYKTVWPIGAKKFNSVTDYPEMGVVIQNNFTEEFDCYFFGRYGRTLEGAAVYAQCGYVLPNVMENLDLKLKGGHLINDFGLYNSTRVNPRTRQGIYLPQAIYPATIRGELASGLGVGFDGKYKNWNFQYAIESKTVLDAESEGKAWATSLNRTDRFFGDMQIATIQYTTDDDNWRFKVSGIRVDLGNDFAGIPRSYSQHLPHLVNNIIMPSIEWHNEKWMLSAEGYALKSSITVPSNPTNNLVYAYSLLGTYEVNPEWTIRANWNQYLSPFKETGDAAIREKHHDLNLGLQWHKNNWLLGGQINWVQGGRFVPYSDFTSDPNSYKNFVVISGNLTYFFD